MAILDYYLFPFYSIFFSIWTSSETYVGPSLLINFHIFHLFIFCVIFWVISSDLSSSSLILPSAISTHSPSGLLVFIPIFFSFLEYLPRPFSNSFILGSCYHSFSHVLKWFKIFIWKSFSIVVLLFLVLEMQIFPFVPSNLVGFLLWFLFFSLLFFFL